MLELPDLPNLTDIIGDRRLLAAIGVAVVSGLVRGFAGFGSALIYMPLVAAVYDPPTAAVTLLLIDFAGAAPFAVRAFRQCTWGEVLPIFIAAAVAVPSGALALRLVDPIVLRWFMVVLIMALLATLVSGWRYRGKPGPALTTGVGLVSGFGAGSVQIAGPPVIVFWLGGDNPAALVRANLLVYFQLTGAVTCVSYFALGLFSSDLVVLSMVLGIPFFAAVAAGAFFFGGSSEALYRRIAYLIVAIAAIISLPLLDPWLR